MAEPPLLSQSQFRKAALTFLVLCLASQIGSAAVKTTAAAGVDSRSAQYGSTPSFTGKEHLPSVAIIGAGIGGASTAHFLNQMFGGRITIHVYASQLRSILHH